VSRVRPSWRWLPAVLAGIATGAMAGGVTVQVSDSSGRALADAVVVLDPLDQMPAATHGSAQIDQVNQQFVPRVTVIRTGTALAFPNSDRVRHQVYSFSSANTFALKLYAGSPKTLVPFDKPGLVTMGCNIHDSMVAFVAVVDSPYFGKSSNQGTLELKVPAGRYRLRVWQETVAKAYRSDPITIAAEPLSLPVKLEVGNNSGITPAWPD